MFRLIREDVEKSVVLVTGKVEVTASNGESVRILPNDRFRQSTDKYVVDKVNVEVMCRGRRDDYRLKTQSLAEYSNNCPDTIT